MSAIQLEENLEKYTRIEACPIRNVISHFSTKWALLVLSVLSENPTTRFNAIGRAIPDLSPKMLSATLKTLEADGLIHRELYPDVPPRVEYSLTDLGKSLIPALLPLIQWAARHHEEIANNRRSRFGQ